jgi:hypothetical protein
MSTLGVLLEVLLCRGFALVRPLILRFSVSDSEVVDMMESRDVCGFTLRVEPLRRRPSTRGGEAPLSDRILGSAEGWRQIFLTGAKSE